jgi:TRAP-type C4-dicarboxylate transport system permease large subunit
LAAIAVAAVCGSPVFAVIGGCARAYDSVGPVEGAAVCCTSSSLRRQGGGDPAAGAVWELAMPVVALGALFGGWLTSPVQAAALTALYAFVIEAFVYRDLRLGRNFVRVLRETALLVGSVLLIFGVCSG